MRKKDRQTKRTENKKKIAERGKKKKERWAIEVKRLKHGEQMGTRVIFTAGTPDNGRL